MGKTAQQDLISEYEYWEVFDSKKQLRYGITSSQDKDIIEKKYPKKYLFERIDLYGSYVWLEKLEQMPKFTPKLTFNQIIILILVILLIISFIAGLIWPEKYSILQIKAGY